MSNVYFVTDGTVGVNPFVTSTTISFKLGQTCLGSDGSQWEYVQASGAIAAYDAVGISELGVAAALTKALADAQYGIGFAQVAFADTEYGWVLRRGKGSNYKVNVLTLYAADAAMYTTATAGKLDDTSASQTKISGVVGTTTAGGSTEAVVMLANYPMVV